MNDNKVGLVSFDDITIDVYNSLDKPIFKLVDVATAINVPEEKFWHVISMCESDEIVMMPTELEDDGFSRIYITESGLYNVLAQSKDLLARRWRRVIIKQLIDMRRFDGMDISEQFDVWDNMLDVIYFDEDARELMVSVTIQGGDVIQVPLSSMEV